MSIMKSIKLAEIKKYHQKFEHGNEQLLESISSFCPVIEKENCPVTEIKCNALF